MWHQVAAIAGASGVGLGEAEWADVKISFE